MPIWYTHNIKNVGEEVLYTIFWINEPYDAGDPDTWFEVVQNADDANWADGHGCLLQNADDADWADGHGCLLKNADDADQDDNHGCLLLNAVIHRFMLHKETTDKIIKAFYNLYNTLGYGFLEKVYENAMLIELHSLDLSVEKQVPIKVYFKEQQVGENYADLIVEDKVILELKAAESLCEEHEFQIINYLKATNIEVGILLNFGKKPQFVRKIFKNK